MIKSLEGKELKGGEQKTLRFKMATNDSLAKVLCETDSKLGIEFINREIVLSILTQLLRMFDHGRASTL